MSRFAYGNNFNRRRSACKRKISATAFPRKSDSRKKDPAWQTSDLYIPPHKTLPSLDQRAYVNQKPMHMGRGGGTMHMWLRPLLR